MDMLLVSVFSVLILSGVSCSWPIDSGSCKDGQGVYLLEMYVPCSLLVDKTDVRNDVYGVYVARETLCRGGNHDCCRTCKHVLQEEFDGGTCVDEPKSIWIADGGYDCNLLLDADAKYNAIMGIYAHRVAICSKGVHQCCHACQTVYDQEGISIPRTTTPLPTSAEVVKVVPTDSVCKDEYVPFNTGRLDCSQLMNPSSPVYNLRLGLCQSRRVRCCVTCSQILQVNTDSSHGGVTYDIDSQQNGGSDSDVTIASVYGDVAQKLDTMESRIHTKVDELQEEVNVLFDTLKHKP